MPGSTLDASVLFVARHAVTVCVETPLVTMTRHARLTVASDAVHAMVLLRSMLYSLPQRVLSSQHVLSELSTDITLAQTSGQIAAQITDPTE